ncbi:MAG: hypothetical protein GXP19_00830 [Gammaproteobacteria bacterium]|nr:hypothetical protein [Gammaproteobacteria bacterium]
MRITNKELRHIALMCTGILSVLSFTITPSFAAGTVKIDDTKWVSVGAGLRTSFGISMDQAPVGNEPSHDFKLESIRLYLNGQAHKNVKFTFNTEYDGDKDVQVIDGIAQIEFSELFNFWMGRFLPPSDRSNLNGPYYLSTWDYPGVVSAYPSIIAGRDDGLALWGQTDGGKMKYQVGMFEGIKHANPTFVPNDKDMPLIAGRFTYNFHDPEPGYYTSGTYYGSKDILALGVALQTQRDGVGFSPTNRGSFMGLSVDVLFEKKVANGGAVTVEGALYDYDTDNVADTTQLQGNGFFVSGAFLFPGTYGIGRLQPHARLQVLDIDNTSGVGAAGKTPTQLDLGLNYIIDGHNARVSFTLSNIDPDTGPGSDYIRILTGIQLQI